jgi:hypothetical protein
MHTFAVNTYSRGGTLVNHVAMDATNLNALVSGLRKDYAALGATVRTAAHTHPSGWRPFTKWYRIIKGDANIGMIGISHVGKKTFAPVR